MWRRKSAGPASSGEQCAARRESDQRLVVADVVGRPPTLPVSRPLRRCIDSHGQLPLCTAPHGTAVHVGRTGAAIRCDEGMGLSELGPQIDRADGVGLLACACRWCRGRDIGSLAGSLTYYFNDQGQVEHISFRGPTGDSTQLVQLLTRTISFSAVASPTGEQVYQVGTRAKCRASCGRGRNRC